MNVVLEDVSPSVSLTMVYDCSPPFSFDSLQWSADLNYDKFHNFILNSAQVRTTSFFFCKKYFISF